MKLGLGVGWRPALAWAIDRREDLGFVEILAEQLDPWGRVPPPITALRNRGVQIVLHSIGLSLGGAEPPDRRRLERLARLAERLGAVAVSDHVCFVRAGGIESGHLLPVQRTEESLEVLVENIALAQKVLPVPLALENIAALTEWPDPRMSEAAFIHKALAHTGASLLLDVANLHANALNHGWSSEAFLDELPLERIAYVHIAGGIEREGMFHDTHAHAIPDGALELLESLAARVDVPGTLLERDDHFPSEAELNGELDVIASTLRRGRNVVRRAS